MFKKALITITTLAIMLLPTTTGFALSFENSNQNFQIALVQLDEELRKQSNLPFLRDKDNNPLQGNVKEKSETLISQVIALMLRFLVGIAVIFIILNGYKFMTAAGDESKVADAKKSLLVLIGGLLVIFLSYSIVSFVFKTVLFVEELDPIKEELRDSQS